MKSLLIILFLNLFFFQDDPDPTRFEDQINAFKAKDKITPPKSGGILFTGSSSIVMWKSLEEDFEDSYVLNRGFGGSHTSDLIYYFKEVVLPYQPSKIVVYEGDNDLSAGKSPERVLSDIKTFHSMVKNNFPDTEIAFIAAKPSPSRWHLKDEYRKFNRLLEKYCKNHPELTFIDVYEAMINESEKPFPELFLADSLHMSAEGYDIWEKLVKPFIIK